jgi:hypothetical protein
MKANHFGKTKSRACEAGQAMVLMLLIFSLVMLGAIAFAVDMGMLWYHRQEAQNAADAACTAGAMDMLVNASGSPTGHQGFTSETSFDCQAHPSYPVCVYAARNGFDSKNTTPGNFVQVSFPPKAQVTGVPSSAVPGAGVVPNAFMRVDVTDRVQTWYSALLSGQTTRTVRSMAVCGVVMETSPVPIVVLHPSQAASLQGNGVNGLIKILGGPSKSIEVNSGSTTAVSFGGIIDLSQGGPNYDGSQLGTWGGPPSPTGTFLPNASYWINHAAPVMDPFQSIPAPPQPAAPATPLDLASNPNCTSVNIQAGSCRIDYWKKAGGIGIAHGCPDPDTSKNPQPCILYTAGVYTGPLNLGGGGGNRSTYVFDPGVYYIKNGITANSNSVLRTSTFTPPAPNNIGGVMFYVTGTAQNCGAGGSKGLICIDSNSGSKATNSPALDTFSVASSQCPGGAAVDPKLLAALANNGTPATGLNGNLLLAPCSGTYGLIVDGLTYRGILFFQDRAATNMQNAYGGGGSSLAAGSMYFHETATYTSHLQLQGNAGSTSFILGEIITDSVGMGGNPTIDMVLNPSKSNALLKATLLPWSATN